ncbi:hypothetical protein GOP47_0023559 [Adiantum capillus-veneris]|uniref:Carboxypeptidase Q n=1 Tax=Adiantum capillus-veneris TaxID=13818 RepID=A0A9D4U3N0_ADICA|nr:hypothetical protein GOP47_0023559 [Adiantum capillus-veneris]
MTMVWVCCISFLLQLQISLSMAVIQLPSHSWELQKDQNAKKDSHSIIEAALSSNSAYNRLAYMTDTFGPRLSGSIALEKALNWTKEEIFKDGLEVQEEPVKVPCWVRGHEYATLRSPRVKDVRIAGLGGSIGTPNGKPLIARVLVVSSFDELETRKNEVKGRIVVYNEIFEGYSTTIKYRLTGAQRAEKYGAVAALVRSVSPFGLQTVHTGYTNAASIPSAAITKEDALMFSRMQERGQEMEIELYMEAHTLPDQMSRNLIIEIKGSEKPEEVVVFGGHMDSWDIADGAMDDGGGAYVSWEAIRLIHSLGLVPKRTVRAVLFVNEENGAMGGQQYYTDHVHELNLTSIAIETDEGNFSPYGISFSGSHKARNLLTDLGQELLGQLGAGNVSGEDYGTDISYVCEKGVPCGSFKTLDPRVGNYANNPCLEFSNPPYPEPDMEMSAYFWYHHTEADTIDKLSPEQLQRCAAALAVWAFSIANLRCLLPR